MWNSWNYHWANIPLLEQNDILAMESWATKILVISHLSSGRLGYTAKGTLGCQLVIIHDKLFIV